MPRTLDLTALRSFVAVAEAGGVTRAAGFLNLTQSAVSMQIKRLEESLDRQLFLRTARRMTLSAEGEVLVAAARRMLDINDDVLARLTADSHEGEIRLGVPCDIVFPAIPGILKALGAQFPRMRVNLTTSFTLLLHEAFQSGTLDVILTTEEQPQPGGEILATLPLTWIGAQGGTAWTRRPLRLGFVETCIFRPVVMAALDAAGIPWEMAYDGRSEAAIEATIAADLSVAARMTRAMPEGTAPIDTRGLLPDLGHLSICLYTAPTLRGPAADALLAELRRAYATQGLRQIAAE
jgi:DNA-binding transcriptional LysR family regulator